MLYNGKEAELDKAVNQKHTVFTVKKSFTIICTTWLESWIMERTVFHIFKNIIIKQKLNVCKIWTALSTMSKHIFIQVNCERSWIHIESFDCSSDIAIHNKSKQVLSTVGQSKEVYLMW